MRTAVAKQKRPHGSRDSVPESPYPTRTRTPNRSSSILGLQRMAGNRAVGQFLQAKLAVRTPGDQYEQEADRVAEQVTQHPQQSISSEVKGASVSPLVQRRVSGSAAGISQAPPSVHDALSSPGQPLPSDLQEEMGQRFGHDFSNVRVHSGSIAEQSAEELSAKAYTVGHDIVLGARQPSLEIGEGRRLMAHELAHVAQQDGGSNALTGGVLTLGSTPPLLQANTNHDELAARLKVVRERLAKLRSQYNQLSDAFTSSMMRERLQESSKKARKDLHAAARTESAAQALWGGTRAAQSIRNAVTFTQGGNAFTVAAKLQITYLVLPDTDARKQAEIDIPHVEAAIKDVWQVHISNGEYAGIDFRLIPKLSYLPHGDKRAGDAFLIQVRGKDNEPSSGDSVTGVISLSPSHLQGARVIVLAHELAHLFGFVDAYLTMTIPGKGGKPPTEQWAVARADSAGRPDLLGMIDPVILARLQKKGAVLDADVKRQTGTVRVWEEDASIVLRTLGIAPPLKPRPTPASDDFDPADELERVRREGDAKLSAIDTKKRRADNSIQWLDVVEEIMRLEAEERDLNSRLRSAKP